MQIYFFNSLFYLDVSIPHILSERRRERWELRVSPELSGFQAASPDLMEVLAVHQFRDPDTILSSIPTVIRCNNPSLIHYNSVTVTVKHCSPAGTDIRAGHDNNLYINRKVATRQRYFNMCRP